MCSLGIICWTWYRKVAQRINDIIYLKSHYKTPSYPNRGPVEKPQFHSHLKTGTRLMCSVGSYNTRTFHIQCPEPCQGLYNYVSELQVCAIIIMRVLWHSQKVMYTLVDK